MKYLFLIFCIVVNCQTVVNLPVHTVPGVGSGGITGVPLATLAALSLAIGPLPDGTYLPVSIVNPATVVASGVSPSCTDPPYAVAESAYGPLQINVPASFRIELTSNCAQANTSANVPTLPEIATTCLPITAAQPKIECPVVAAYAPLSGTSNMYTGMFASYTVPNFPLWNQQTQSSYVPAINPFSAKVSACSTAKLCPALAALVNLVDRTGKSVGSSVSLFSYLTANNTPLWNPVPLYEFGNGTPSQP
jgi:hypothetical protein